MVGIAHATYWPRDPHTAWINYLFGMSGMSGTGVVPGGH
jgi:hypothetical protein